MFDVVRLRLIKTPSSSSSCRYPPADSRCIFCARFTDDDFPYSTDIVLEEGAAGNTDIDAIIVMDDISDAWVREAQSA